MEIARLVHTITNCWELLKLTIRRRLHEGEVNSSRQWNFQVVRRRFHVCVHKNTNNCLFRRSWRQAWDC